jgi:hypothetical protein
MENITQQHAYLMVSKALHDQHVKWEREHPYFAMPSRSGQRFSEAEERKIRLVLGGICVAVVSLGVLFLLVQFVHWAWYF